MKGIDKIREFLGDYKSNYVVIGGTAVDLNLENEGVRGRATKDIDMVVVCEAMTADYIRDFWRFIKAGGYKTWQIKEAGESRRCFYRFVEPTDSAFPDYIELFSRKPDMIELLEDTHLVHIPNEEYLSSFSAILMDDNYYHYAVSHSKEIEGIMVLDVAALIVLKAKAYINNRDRKLSGTQIQSGDIVKHKKDIYRLSYLLQDTDRYEVESSIAADLSLFCDLLLAEPVDGKAIAKYMGVQPKAMDEVVTLIKTVFAL